MRTSRWDYSAFSWTSALGDRIQQFLWPLTDHIIVNSRAGLDIWRERRVPGTKLSYIANGIDAQIYSPDPDAGGAVRRELGLSEHATLVGVVSRIEPVKDHMTFINAAHRLRDTVPDAHFVCIGGAVPGMESYAEKLGRHVERLGLTDAFHWLGDRSDVPRWLAALDVMVSPSRMEGFSNSIAEGLACGVPCVVTDVGDSAAIVETVGRVVPPEDADALADECAQILALSKGERATISSRSRARVEQLFSVERMADETLRVLDEVRGASAS